MAFKAPTNIAQDLLLIQDLLGPPEPKILPDVSSPSSDSEDIDSTSSECSEDEVVNLIGDEEDAKIPPISTEPESDSDTDSDLDSDVGDSILSKIMARENFAEEDDDEEVITSGSYLTTKNEITDDSIVIPDIEEVPSTETLTKVGEIMNIIEQTVIVKGLPLEVVTRGSDQALDAETLLVFDDRKVFGYIFETFGPTFQPFYQVKFNSAYPLDPEKIRVGREVFHIPSKSLFIYLNAIRHLKGSDASNVNDEEPADNELEFSDDEAEAVHKSILKQRRRARSGSVSSSRFGTPTPMRDQDMSYMPTGDAYAEHGPYDMDFTGGSSRPTPIPYDDDPYSDIGSVESESMHTEPVDMRTQRGRVRPPRGIDRRRPRGRGRGGSRRDFSSSGQSFAFNSGGPSPSTSSFESTGAAMPQYRHQPQTPFLPQFSGHQFQPPSGFHMQQQQQQTVPPFVQPHINPRFASSFGMPGMPPLPSPVFFPTQQYPEYTSSPENEWSVRMRTGDGPGTT